MFPLSFWRGSIAIRYASYHFQTWSVPSPLRYENNAEKNLFQWKQKAHPIWKLERSDSNPVWWKHSISWPHFDVFIINFEHISHLVPTSLLSTLSRYILTGLIFICFEHINILILWKGNFSRTFGTVYNVRGIHLLNVYIVQFIYIVYIIHIFLTYSLKRCCWCIY